MDDFYQVDYLMDKLDIEKPVAEYLIFIYDKTKALVHLKNPWDWIR